MRTHLLSSFLVGDDEGGLTADPAFPCYKFSSHDCENFGVPTPKTCAGQLTKQVYVWDTLQQKFVLQWVCMESDYQFIVNEGTKYSTAAYVKVGEVGDDDYEVLPPKVCAERSICATSFDVDLERYVCKAFNTEELTADQEGPHPFSAPCIGSPPPLDAGDIGQ